MYHTGEQTQYRVVYSDHNDHDAEMADDLEEAQELVDDHGGVIQRRTVTYGPWEDAPDA